MTTPSEAPAVVQGDVSLTRAELETRARRLAGALRERGVGPEDVVGVQVPRSPDAIVALLAVRHAGAAYLPLDPSYPPARIRAMVEDSGAKLVIGTDLPASAAGPEIEPVARHPRSAAYVIYTSGSTGAPKGVVVEDASLAAFSATICRRFALTAADRVLQFASLSFDTAVEEIWPALDAGATLVLRDVELWDPEELCDRVDRQGITVLDLPTAYWHEIVRAGVDPTASPSLRLVVIGGEAASPEAAGRWHAAAARPEVVLLNTYGPTETTVSATAHELVAADAPIGRPLDGVRTHVIEEELWIGGAGVARGYLGRPGMTADRFRPDPTAPGARMYRTGDRVAVRDDGVLDFLGRTDDQLKIRGFRVEPREIETALGELPGVAQAVVRAFGSRLVAYVVPAGEIDTSALRDRLAERLPPHMVPGAIVPLERLPLTPAGKVDRRALPDPRTLPRPGAAPATEHPTSEQAAVAAAFAELLGVEAQATDSFFDLGGDSLLATRLISRLRRELAVGVPLRAVFEHPTVEGLARVIRTAGRSGEPGEGPPLVAAGRPERLPLSFGQQRMWFVDQFDPDGSGDVLAGTARLHGRVDPGALRLALADLVARHEALRTSFPARGGEPVQVVAPTAVPELAELRAESWEAAESLASRHVHERFDLAAGPLVRAALVRAGDDAHVLSVALHHIVSDGWSMGVLAGDLSELYAARLERREPRLPALPVQYADYALWQRHRLDETLDRELAWWRERLEGSPHVLELPGDRPRPAVQSFRGGHVQRPVGAVREARIDALAQASAATPFMVMLAGFALLLRRYTGAGDLLVGAPIANRTRAEVEHLIGFFVNTLPLRVRIDDDATFTELLAQVRATTLDAYAHQDLPFERMVEGLEAERAPSHNPLVQVLFAVQNTPQAPLALAGCEPAELVTPTEAVAVDLTLEVERAGGELVLNAIHALDLFDPQTVERMLGHYLALLDDAAARPDVPVSRLDMLGRDEREHVVATLNDTARPYDADATIPELFAAQVAARPDAEAVRSGDRALTYAELDRAADGAAGALVARGVRPGDRVAVLLDRGVDLVITLLGVLKAGAAYVPIDPENPPRRILYLLRSARARAVVDAPMEPEAFEAPSFARSLHEVAYVIHTSGSTGEPKGIAVPHRAIVRLVRGADYVQLAPGDTVAQASNASFDAATFEIWGALLNGARLVAVEKDELLVPARLRERIAADGITTLFVTTALFNAIAEEAPDAFNGLRELLFGGEASDAGCVRGVLAAGGPRRLLHVYGPTEATTFASWHEVRALDEDTATVPIGLPIANTTLHLLDTQLDPVPIGVPGEVLLGGPGLAHGYLGRPGLTAERFVPDPFSPGGRLYRTGDIGRRRADGSVEFLGRRDHQVKVRGFRVELGEVEALLALHPDVVETAVLARDGRIDAYVTVRNELTERRLRAHMADVAPAWMAPSTITILAAMPLNPSGKIDRRALPAPDPARAEQGTPFEAPRSDAEVAVARLFEELLDVPRVGLHDDFFALGGHSLLATRAISRLRDEHGVDIPLRALFENSSPARLAPLVESAARPAASVPMRRLPRPA